MNEKMRDMVGTGELSEASYKMLVDELGRVKKEVDTAPLFEVTYTANVIIAIAEKSTRDDDDDHVYTKQSSFSLHGGPKSKIVRGVGNYRPFTMCNFHATNQFVDFDEIVVGADNEPKNCKPGDTIYQHSMCEHSRSGVAGESCLVVYTIISVSKFKKRKSYADSEE